MTLRNIILNSRAKVDVLAQSTWRPQIHYRNIFYGRNQLHWTWEPLYKLIRGRKKILKFCENRDIDLTRTSDRLCPDSCLETLEGWVSSKSTNVGNLLDLLEIVLYSFKEAYEFFYSAKRARHKNPLHLFSDVRSVNQQIGSKIRKKSWSTIQTTIWKLLEGKWVEINKFLRGCRLGTYFSQWNYS